MSKSQLLNSAADMKWLRDAHLHGLHGRFKSAVIFGNEDWPDSVHLYTKRSPLVTDAPVIYKPDEDGSFYLSYDDRALPKAAPIKRRKR